MPDSKASPYLLRKLRNQSKQSDGRCVVVVVIAMLVVCNGKTDDMTGGNGHHPPLRGGGMILSERPKLVFRRP